jgi:hypothetical protein
MPAKKAAAVMYSLRIGCKNFVFIIHKDLNCFDKKEKIKKIKN